MERRELPNSDRLGVVAALVLLVYALMPFTSLPVSEIPFNIFGIRVAIPLNPYMIISLLTAAAAASGADWILQGHPRLAGQKTMPYIILPGLVAWALGFPLGALDPGPTWWAVLVLGVLFLLLVLVGEYTALDADGYYFPLAQMALTAVACGVLLTVTAAIRFTNVRVYSLVAIITPLSLFFALRLLQLRLARWQWDWSTAIALILTQLAVGLHYWPFTAVSSGLMLVGVGYALVNWAASRLLRRDARLAALESVGMTVFCVVMAILTG